MAVLFASIPIQAVIAQTARVEPNAPRANAPTLPKRPPVAQPAPKAAPPTTQPITPLTKNEVEALTRPGHVGVMLGARIDNTISFLGLSRCGPRIKQVMLALSDNRQTAYYFEAMTRIASQGPVIITLESLNGDAPDSGSRYAVVTVNPDCSGFYTQTISWPMACPDVARFAFPNFVFDRRIVANVDSFRAGPTLQLSAMKTLSGCVTVKKEIFR